MLDWLESVEQGRDGWNGLRRENINSQQRIPKKVESIDLEILDMAQPRQCTKTPGAPLPKDGGNRPPSLALGL
jgi:hypothetical protein